MKRLLLWNKQQHTGNNDERVEEMIPLIVAIIGQARKDAVAGCPYARAWLLEVNDSALYGEQLAPLLEKSIDDIEMDLSRSCNRAYMQKRYREDAEHRQRRKEYQRRYRSQKRGAQPQQ